MKKLNNQNGFTAVEVVLVVLLVGALGIAGYFAYKNQHTTATKAVVVTTKSAPAKTVASPYAGWKTYSSAYEGASFKYPSSWTLAVSPEPVSNGNVDNGNVLTLKSPSGYVVNFQAPDQSQGGGCSGTNTIDQVTKLTAQAKNPLYLTVVNHSGQKDFAVYDLVPPSQNNYQVDAVVPHVGESLCDYNPSYSSKGQSGAYISFYGSSNESLTDAQFLALPDSQTAELIFKSLSY
jgi:type II secretory pathway pseudopilin PulG